MSEGGYFHSCFPECPDCKITRLEKEVPQLLLITARNRALAAELEKLWEVAGRVPHLEQLLDPLTGKREGRHHYRVEKHARIEGGAECRQVGGQCAVRDAIAKPIG